MADCVISSNAAKSHTHISEWTRAERIRIRVKSPMALYKSDNSWMEGIPTETKNYINFILYHKPTEYKSDEELAKLKHLYDGIYTNR